MRWGVGSYGGETPVIDRLSHDRSTTFQRLIAPANWTIPSHISFFTGAYPSSHGVRTFQKGDLPTPGVAPWLHSRGYETGLFTEQLHLVSGYGLEQGFDTRCARRVMSSREDRTPLFRLVGYNRAFYSDILRQTIRCIPPAVFAVNAFCHPQEKAFKAERCSNFVVDGFREWINQRRAEAPPFFAFVNLVDAHEPYPLVDEMPELSRWRQWFARTPRYFLLAIPEMQRFIPWRELERGYRGAIRAADAKVGEMLGILEEADEFDQTLVVITSDHGQSFGERGNVYHGCGATDSIARVPAVVRPPEGVTLPRVVDRWVSLCELSGWIKATASGLPPFDEHGWAPHPYEPESRDSGPRVYFEGGPASDQNWSLRGRRMDLAWNHRLLAAYGGETKYLLDCQSGSIESWSYPSDPDRVPGISVAPTDRAEVRRLIFGPYEELAARKRVDESGILQHPDQQRPSPPWARVDHLWSRVTLERAVPA